MVVCFLKSAAKIQQFFDIRKSWHKKAPKNFGAYKIEGKQVVRFRNI